MARIVHLHVGIAKTGTTYLQRRLFANREQLARHGMLYPGSTRGAHFLASLDLRGSAFKGHVYDGTAGAWDRLVREVERYDGAALISHETLARSTPEQITRAVGSFGADDVRVIVTARDLVRQLPAAWQETVKNRATTPYERFLATVFETWPPQKRPARSFWSTQDIAALVDRWRAVVGDERVTVVTVPPAGAPRDELWRRFSAAAGLPDLDYAESGYAGNTSLGVAEAELLRRLNPLLDGVLDWPAYEARVKRRLSEGVLGPLDGAGRLSLPPTWIQAARDISSTQIERLEGTGVAVLGDLADLDPGPGPVPTGRQPADLKPRVLLDTALRALAVLAAEPVRRPGGPVGTGSRLARLAARLPDPVVDGARRLRDRLPGGRGT